MTDRELLKRAAEAQKNAYAPYSKFYVGAALLASDGRVFAGCNVENASYGACICAERAALAAAVSAGARDFIKLAVIGSGDAICMPCGICRQMLIEFGGELEVVCSNNKLEHESFKLSDLLANHFG